VSDSTKALLIVGLSALLAACRLSPQEVTKMRCKELSTPGIEQRIAEYASKPRYMPTRGLGSTVSLRFDLDPAWAGDGTFIVISNRINQTLYVGPYAPEIALNIGPELTSQDGYDNLEFRLLRPTPGLHCIWATDPGFPFWGNARTLDICLMVERSIDSSGLIHGYHVQAHP